MIASGAICRDLYYMAEISYLRARKPRMMEQQNCQIVNIGKIEIPARPSVKDTDKSAVAVLATRNLVLFPAVTIPIDLVRESALRVARYAVQEKKLVVVACQNDPTSESARSAADVARYAVFAQIIDVIDLPNDSHTALVRGLGRVRSLGDAGQSAFAGCDLTVRVRSLSENEPGDKDGEWAVLGDSIKAQVRELSKKGMEDAMLFQATEEANSISWMINNLATQLPFPQQEKVAMLGMYHMKQRGIRLLSLLSLLGEKADIANSIRQKAHEEMSRNQREAFLREQMDAIHSELYGSEADGVEALRRRAADAPLPEAVRAKFDKEAAQLGRVNPTHPDYAVGYGYLETLLDLPWGVTTPLNTDFAKAEEILDSEHFGLEKVKERVLEQLAAMMNNPGGRSPIICLVGAPGVGKTSLGESIAEALGRKYQRVSLGGLHDEAEIRGHRRTYVGAMPGRIIDAVRRAGSSNPVLLLDEVDKIGSDFKGDPSAALLEVLDPEQNCRFHDNYVDVDFDLSDVLFIATANTLQTLSQPLLDRMEIIEIAGYSEEEKLEIARRHLIPRQLKANLLTGSDLAFSDDALRKIIEGYTAESGVRQLEKAITSVVRKVILRKIRGEEIPRELAAEDIRRLLGLETRHPGRYEGNDTPGVVTGLAWTAVGGEILFVESSLAKAKGGEKLILTGNLGDVMKESAVIALQYVRSHAADYGIDPGRFEEERLHIHVPEGAIPKDGPSAGVTMVTSIVSAFTGRKVRPRLAMTGEITLRGRVLPVGGIKEKILAAKRAGITDIILCEDNRRDIEEIPRRYLAGLTFHYATTIAHVTELALLP